MTTRMTRCAPGEPVGCRDVARSERGEGGRVQRLEVADGRDLLAVLVHQEDDVGVRVLAQALERLLDLLKLLVVKDEVRRSHGLLTDSPVRIYCTGVA
jgi:hypothetical protein